MLPPLLGHQCPIVHADMCTPSLQTNRLMVSIDRLVQQHCMCMYNQPERAQYMVATKGLVTAVDRTQIDMYMCQRTQLEDVCWLIHPMGLHLCRLSLITTAAPAQHSNLKHMHRKYILTVPVAGGGKMQGADGPAVSPACRITTPSADEMPSSVQLEELDFCP